MGAIECTVATAAAVAHGVFVYRGYTSLASGASTLADVSPIAPFVWPCVYVAGVFAGNALMASRKEMACKASMAIYNLYATGLSAVMFALFAREIGAAGLAGTFTSRANSPALTAVIWVAYQSKFIEYFDTLFMVLRKKQKQISTLHVVHHAEMAPLTWWWLLNGTLNCAFGPLLNAAIHTAMYGYYGLTGMGIKMGWFAPYMTAAQMLQFLILVVHSVFHIVAWNVHWPASMAVAELLLMVQMVSAGARGAEGRQRAWTHLVPPCSWRVPAARPHTTTRPAARARRRPRPRCSCTCSAPSSWRSTSQGSPRHARRSRPRLKEPSEDAGPHERERERNKVTGLTHSCR